ncbi:MAG: hypothetical protein G01um101418_312 [Parcubacteria group bacterium Gr01-1014_18]|nr:MAG: hypothetical protein Greene041636_312 [Parcubacteria group bacterium Greene0416_36]TSC81172.1 MAG: hypothetical protein G01um101418_312 [Parcubacteria group bacterium Gr01-1014_18]TSC99169.1 MAG: hypothetical protein Greene101420_314 [Parcubacteria group bacterium Greene1014_20]TSD07473.1 MAG: hypothetical protein Greene07142_172 [Parcubacteria group bacterium Greene0714_2]
MKGGDIMMKKLGVGIMSVIMSLNMLAVPVAVGAAEDVFGINFQKNTGLGQRDPRETIAALIRIIMGFLGTVAVVIILMGGFKWMTAGGSSDKTDEAKKLIQAGIIGLVIILSAFAITTFVLQQLTVATGLQG